MKNNILSNLIPVSFLFFLASVFLLTSVYINPCQAMDEESVSMSLVRHSKGCRTCESGGVSNCTTGNMLKSLVEKSEEGDAIALVNHSKDCRTCKSGGVSNCTVGNIVSTSIRKHGSRNSLQAFLSHSDNCSTCNTGQVYNCTIGNMLKSLVKK